MRLELTIPDSTSPVLKAHIVALLDRLHSEPEFAAEIDLANGSDDAAIQKMFTPERLAHIEKSDAEIDAGEFFTPAQVDEHFRRKQAEWTLRTPR